ncbi:MAG: type I-U CRISPR-associated protein Csx17 [Candidatus Binatia bacterium]
MMAVHHDFELAGCTPEPLVLEGLHTGSLGHYFAALGVLRATTNMERGNEIRGCWKNGRFLLYGPGSTLDREALCEFLLKDWKPVAFERWWSKAQSGSKKDPDALPKLRASEPDERVDQLDAVMVQANRRIFNDLFGTGGNIAKRNLAVVWKRSLELSKKPEAKSWLEHTLFGVDDVSLPELQGAGTWFVFSNKTFNSGQDWYQEGRLSPWSFLLAMEGALLLRGGVHRRLGTQTKGKGVFPFMCRPMNPPTDGQVAQGKSEFWAPLWSKLARMVEIEMLFRAGLAEVGGRPASAPHEFAVAALDAAVDAGVAAFIRFELRQTTSAQAFEALPRGKIQVRHASGPRHSKLLLPLIISRWIDRLPDEPRNPKQRGTFVGLRGPVEAAMVRLAEDPDDPERWRDLLLLLARTQERVDRNKTLRERCNPLPRLSPSWFERAWASPPVELQVARAVASIGAAGSITNQLEDTEHPVLFNIFGVEREGGSRISFPKARPARAVWHNGRLVSVLIDIMKRRLVDADELDPVPLRGTCPCSVDAIASFLWGEGCDDELVARWIPPLALIDWKRTRSGQSDGKGSHNFPLHPLYSLFRPLIDPEGLRGPFFYCEKTIVESRTQRLFECSSTSSFKATSIRRLKSRVSAIWQPDGGRLRRRQARCASIANVLSPHSLSQLIRGNLRDASLKTG